MREHGAWKVGTLGAPVDDGAQRSAALYPKLSPGPGRSAQQVAAHQRRRIQAAMIELAAESGYGAVTVRELTRAAGVSTRAFYELFARKEDVLLSVYELLAERAARQALAAQRGESEPRRRLRMVFAAIGREIAREPHAARLALLEAPVAGPEAVARVRRADRAVEATVHECLTANPNGAMPPPLAARGIVAGTSHVIRARLRSGREWELPALSGKLAEWALACGSVGPALGQLDGAPLPTSSDPLSALTKRPSPGDARELILAAVCRLAIRDDFRALSVSRICATAGVSRRAFEAHFADAADCLLVACERRIDHALAGAACVGKARGGGWAASVHGALTALCAHIAHHRESAKLTLLAPLAVGRRGVDLRDRLIETAATDLRTSAPSGQRPTELAAAASAGAAWGIVCDQVAAGRAAQLPRLAPALALFLLVPVCWRP